MGAATSISTLVRWGGKRKTPEGTTNGTAQRLQTGDGMTRPNTTIKDGRARQRAGDHRGPSPITAPRTTQRTPTDPGTMTALPASTSGGSKDEGERFQLLEEAVALSILAHIGANLGRALRRIASLSDEAIYFGGKSFRAIYFGCKSRLLNSSWLSRFREIG